MPFAWEELALGWAVVFFAGVVQGTIGFGYAAISVPVLSLINPSFAPLPQILMSIPMTFYMAWRERSGLDWSGASWIIAGRIPGTAAGALLLALVTRRTLEVIIAFLIMIAVLLLARGATFTRSRFNRFVAGMLSGIASMTAAIGGPPIAFLYRDLPGPVMRSSLAAIFFIGIVMSAIALFATGKVDYPTIMAATGLVPALLLGVYCSRFLTGRIEGKPLRIATLIVAGSASLVLAARALMH